MTSGVTPRSDPRNTILMLIRVRRDKIRACQQSHLHCIKEEQLPSPQGVESWGTVSGGTTEPMAS